MFNMLSCGVRTAYRVSDFTKFLILRRLIMT